MKKIEKDTVSIKFATPEDARLYRLSISERKNKEMRKEDNKPYARENTDFNCG